MFGQKKYFYFQKYGWREKSSPGGLQIYFFSRFSGDVLFASLVSFAIFDSCFFCLFVCFLKLKKYIYFHLADFRKQDYFFWPYSCLYYSALTKLYSDCSETILKTSWRLVMIKANLEDLTTDAVSGGFL